MTDTSKIEKNVCEKIAERARVGKKKYGVTMDREDVSVLGWLKHAQEEAMDLSVYLEKIIQLSTEVMRQSKK